MRRFRVRAASALTYGILVGLVSIVALSAIINAGSAMNSLFGRTASVISGARVATPAPVAAPTTVPTGPFTFTSCGATGPTGPSSAACTSAYAGTSLAGLVTVSSGLQSFTVPQSGTWRIRVEGAEGAQAGGCVSGSGQGGIAEGTISLTAGETLVIAIGQRGEAGSKTSSLPLGGFNGGGTAGNSDSGVATGANPGGGGGGSDVRRSGSSLSNRMIVAAGGGGGSTGDGSNCSRTAGAGGADTGESATGSSGSSCSGGTQSSGGTSAGGGSGLGVGGNADSNEGGGGGGGYYGGGGNLNGGGCGGSNLIGSGVTPTQNQRGGRTGDGRVVLTLQ